jgi:hypothetical protein
MPIGIRSGRGSYVYVSLKKNLLIYVRSKKNKFRM